jgi:pilus assembly protein TadC
MDRIYHLKNESTPLVFILISVFLYSLFPLIGVFGTMHVSGFVFSGLSHTLSALLSIFVSLWLSLKVCKIDVKNLFHEFIQDKVALRQAAISKMRRKPSPNRAGI